MDAKIANFVNVTGADESRASFFLNSCNGDLDAAVNMFFSNIDHDGSGPMEMEGLSPPPPIPPRTNPPVHPGAPPPQSSVGKPTAPLSKPAPATSSQPKPKPSKPAAAAPASKFRTLSDFRSSGAGESGHGDGDDDDDEDEEGRHGNETYAGGASSGISIQHPGTKKANTESIKKEILERAKERGAKDYEEFKKESSAPFTGAGYRLGQTVDAPSKPLKGTATNKREVRIIFWTDGFSVDDGPLRSFDNPQDKAFMDEINQNRIPTELRQQLATEMDPALGPPEILIHLVDKHEPYSPPPKTFKAFAGQGHSLSSSSNSASTAAPMKTAPTKKLEVDPNKEQTTIQIRLADGTRLQAKFNLDHTIGDIVNFINCAKVQTQAYDLITTLPRHVFSDMNQTIAAAGLKNACVVQHLK